MISSELIDDKLCPLKILLADDDKDDRFLFSLALDEISMPSNLVTFVDGEKLMDYLFDNDEPFSGVVFIDMNMPRKGGLECLSEIKQTKKLKDLPLIIFSTSNSRDMIDKAFRNGADVYIQKPSDFSQLKQVIFHALPIAIEKMSSNSSLKYILNA
jgi:CheY-like chemotaxis protein